MEFFQPHTPWLEAHKRKSFVDVAWEDGDDDADVEVRKAAVVPHAATTASLSTEPRAHKLWPGI